MRPDFDKGNGLIPAIIQDDSTEQVLMLGYMNEEAYQKTIDTRVVTFYSRSRQCLWIKGETSGNYLDLVSINLDCDNDSFLLRVTPHGPVCHLGTVSCFSQKEVSKREAKEFIYALDKIIESRLHQNETGSSYTKKLAEKGIKRIAQKVGEEAVELVIEAQYDQNTRRIIEESADLLYHLLVLLRMRGLTLRDIEEALFKRHRGD